MQEPFRVILLWFLFSLRSLGWLALILGLLILLFIGPQYLFGKPTDATVVGLEMRCSAKRCKDCKEQALRCAQIDNDSEAEYYSVSRIRYAKVRFQTLEGRQIETEAAFPKLALSGPVVVGQSIRLRYSPRRPAHVSSEKLPNGIPFAFLLMAGGVIFIVLNGYLRSQLQPPIRQTPKHNEPVSSGFADHANRDSSRESTLAARLTISAIMLVFFGGLALNTHYRFAQQFDIDPLIFMQWLVDLTLTSWLGNEWTVRALAFLAILAALLTARKSYGPRAKIALHGTASALQGKVYRPANREPTDKRPSGYNDRNN